MSGLLSGGRYICTGGSQFHNTALGRYRRWRCVRLHNHLDCNGPIVLLKQPWLHTKESHVPYKVIAYEVFGGSCHFNLTCYVFSRILKDENF